MRQSETNVQRENVIFLHKKAKLGIFKKSKELVVNSYLLVVYSIDITQNYMLFQLEHSFTEG